MRPQLPSKLATFGAELELLAAGFTLGSAGYVVAFANVILETAFKYCGYLEAAD